MVVKFTACIWKGILPAFIVLVLLASFGGPHSLIRIYSLLKYRDHIKEDILDLAEKNKLLRKKIQGLRNDPESIYRIAREELGLVKPGEIIYRYYKIQNLEKPGRIEEKKCPKY
jgi:cell division protein FtsB